MPGFHRKLSETKPNLKKLQKKRKVKKMSRKKNKKHNKFGNRANQPSPAAAGEVHPPLCRRAVDDPMRLHGAVVTSIKNYNLKAEGTSIFTSPQLEALSGIAEQVLSATPGTVYAVPLVPGGGKSTLIRAVLAATAKVFAAPSNPLAAKIGGIIIVVEKSAEAHDLAALCGEAAGQTVATVIESPNDFNLCNGCPNGTATRFEECLRRQCPDYSRCPLAQAASKTGETPILIMLHARYQYHIEDMSPFLTWSAGAQVYQRTLLLVDELPGMFEDNSLCLATLNEAETELDKLKASYRSEQRFAKQAILYHWSKDIRTPFFKLSRLLCASSGIITETMMAEAGFRQVDLEQLQEKLMEYSRNSKAEVLVSALLSRRNICHSMDQTFTLFVPRLKSIDTQSRLTVVGIHLQRYRNIVTGVGR